MPTEAFWKYRAEKWLSCLLPVCLLIGCDSKQSSYESDHAEIINYLEKHKLQMQTSGLSDVEIRCEIAYVERMQALLESEDSGASIRHKIPRALSGIISTTVAGHSIQLYDQDVRAPLGASSELEATLLYDVERAEFFNRDKLHEMSAIEASQLDVEPRHPAWYTREDQPADPVNSFRQAMIAGINNALREKDDIKAGVTWDPDSTRRVLFLDEVYKSATSAKAEVEDAYGVEWKIKWGDEVQSEAISSRLYLMSGGRMTDFIVVGGDPSEMVMILAKKGKYTRSGQAAEEKREPENVYQLAEALHDFYGFDITPYIHSHGTIFQENIDSLSHILPPDGKKKRRATELIGRKWVSFREYSLELRPKGFIHNVAGSILTDSAAKDDRAARGLYLFSLWLSARDSKSDNSKTYFMRTLDKETGSEMKISGHAAGLHDLGVTLGKMGAAGMINEMTTGEDFLWTNPSEKTIRSRQAFVYMPEPYTKATWSDSRWMAIRIADISDNQLTQAISGSKWPDFVQAAAFYKLAARRNRIAEMFEIPPDTKRGEAPAPNFFVDLSTPEKVRDIERRYQLVPGSLQREIESREGQDFTHEILVDSGQISATKDSALITQLVIQRFPAGLSDRYRRSINLNPEAIRTQ